MDLPLAKAEPTSDGDSASGKTNLKREKALKLQMERGGIIWEKKSTSESPRGVVKKAGEEAFQALEQRFPCSPGEAAVLLQPVEVHDEAEIHLQLVEDSKQAD